MTARRRRFVSPVLLALLLAGQALSLLALPGTARAEDGRPPLAVRLVPGREDAARAAYDRHPEAPAADETGRSFRSDWRRLTRDAEPGGDLARWVGVVRGLVYGLREQGPRLHGAAQQLGGLMWDLVTRPGPALARVRGLLGGAIDRFPEAFGSIGRALEPPSGRFDQAATEMAVLLGEQAIVDALQHERYGQAVGRGLYELLALYGPAALADAGADLRAIFAEATAAAGSALGRYRETARLLDESLRELARASRAAGRLPFAQTRVVAARMVDHLGAPADLARRYPGLIEHLSRSPYLARDDALADVVRQAQDCARLADGPTACRNLAYHLDRVLEEFGVPPPERTAPDARRPLRSLPEEDEDEDEAPADAPRSLFATAASTAGVRPRPPLTVMTFNLHGKEGIDVDRIATIVGNNGADVVGLQEVCAADLLDLRDRLRSTHLVHEVRWDAAFAAHVRTWTPAWSEPGCAFGNALLSKVPLLDVVKQELRCAPRPGSAGESCPEDRGRHAGINFDGEERRQLICGTIEPARSARLRVCSTHVSGEGHRTAQQTQFLADRARGIRIPAIILGDFNARPGSPALRPMAAQFDEVDRDAAPTSPVDEPSQKIDHIFVSPAIGVRSADVLRTQASDHLPLLARLRLPPP